MRVYRSPSRLRRTYRFQHGTRLFTLAWTEFAPSRYVLQFFSLERGRIISKFRNYSVRQFRATFTRRFLFLTNEILVTWNLLHLRRTRVCSVEMAASSITPMQNKHSEIIRRVSTCTLPSVQQRSELPGFCPILQRTLNEP